MPETELEQKRGLLKVADNLLRGYEDELEHIERQYQEGKARVTSRMNEISALRQDIVDELEALEWADCSP